MCADPSYACVVDAGTSETTSPSVRAFTPQGTMCQHGKARSQRAFCFSGGLPPYDPKRALSWRLARKGMALFQPGAGGFRRHSTKRTRQLDLGTTSPRTGVRQTECDARARADGKPRAKPLGTSKAWADLLPRKRRIES